MTSSIGFTYSIFNNKIAKGKVWHAIYISLSNSNQNQIEKLIVELYHSLKEAHDTINSKKLKLFMDNGYTDSTQIDKKLKKKILTITGLSYLKQINACYNEIDNQFQSKVIKQLLWTATINGQFVNGLYLNGFVASSTISKVFYTDIKKGKQFSFQLTPSYQLTSDSTQKEKNRNRSFSRITGGVNFAFSKTFEMKLLFGWEHVINSLYKDEDKDKYDFSITSRIKINDNFSLPVTFRYDIKHPQLWGFLSIQYTLK